MSGVVEGIVVIVTGNVYLTLYQLLCYLYGRVFGGGIIIFIPIITIIIIIIFINLLLLLLHVG